MANVIGGEAAAAVYGVFQAKPFVVPCVPVAHIVRSVGPHWVACLRTHGTDKHDFFVMEEQQHSVIYSRNIRGLFFTPPFLLCTNMNYNITWIEVWKSSAFKEDNKCSLSDYNGPIAVTFETEAQKWSLWI